uniref:Uncharacterized protein n=1 Tax=Lotharella globosa TaxID=91324 RepID=A0A7S4DE99_9EUKA
MATRNNSRTAPLRLVGRIPLDKQRESTMATRNAATYGGAHIAKLKVDKELEALEKGYHEGYTRKVKILTDRLKATLAVIEAKRKERLRHISLMYEAELKASGEDLQYQKECVFLEMQETLKEKKRKIQAGGRALFTSFVYTDAMGDVAIR